MKIVFCRLHKEVCETQRTDCDYSNSTTPVVKDLCDGKTSCEVEASNDQFVNQCHMTYKYLEIKYKCVTDMQAGEENVTTNCLLCGWCSSPSQSLMTIHSQRTRMVSANLCKTTFTTMKMDHIFCGSMSISRLFFV